MTTQELLGKMAVAAAKCTTKHYRVSHGEEIAGFTVGSRVGGRGASASVFTVGEVHGGDDEMSDENTRRNVIKIYRDDEYDYDVYKNEVRILVELAEKNVVGVPHMVRAGALTSMKSSREVALHPWIIMDNAGDSLRAILKRSEEGRLPRAVAMMVICQIAAGISAIHAANVIHGDINPSNITMRDGEIKIIDFGSSCTSSYRFQHQPGTLPYRAPEIIMDSGYSFPADVWSAGVTFCEILAGIVPFDYDGEEGIMYSVDSCVGRGDECDECDDEEMSDVSSNASTSEEESQYPPEKVVKDLEIIYRVIAAPVVQPADHVVELVPVPLGIAALIMLNTDLELADAWYITDIVSPLLQFYPHDRRVADEMIKN